MPVKWLREALNNLDEIAAFIAQESPAAAKQVVDRLQKATQRLSQHPQMGRPGASKHRGDFAGLSYQSTTACRLVVPSHSATLRAAEDGDEQSSGIFRRCTM
jgi:plasmid stabilization system protein ParE